MNTVRGSFTLVLVATLGLACSGTGLGTSGPGKGGQSGSSASGRAGSGGAGSGGVFAEGGSGGTAQASGGSAAGGTTSTGGILAAGGRGGSNAGGSAAGGVIGVGGSMALGGRGGSNAGGSTLVGGRGGSNAGGTRGAGGTTSCATLVACPAIACLYGDIPNPDPCGCPICAGPDAGTIKDASSDGPCLALPCALPLCGPGQVIVTPTCGCSTCVSVDGGQTDAVVCPPIGCPAVKCAPGTVPTLDRCGCTVCTNADAGTDSKADASKLACVNLDECSCLTANGCSPIAESCYCPSQCNGSVCKCGGGKSVGCAPVDLSTCANAKARVGTLCPKLSGATFDGLCSQTNTLCITKCLNDVTSCSDVGCTFCEACDCATDNFLTCVGKCSSGVATK
jgi:hypothetical protein